MAKKDKFIAFLEDTLLAVIPDCYKKDGKLCYFNKPESKQLFLEIMCKKACLNPKSADVQKAFNNILAKQVQS
jgi:hypothetical protein